MRTRLLLLVTALVALSTNLAPATVRYVPEVYTTIQLAINNASDGDVISVWGPPPGQPSYPPYHYYENVNYGNKRLVVASRCFLPGWTGCAPTYDSVVIDGQRLGSVVTMTGSEDAVLKGFTIQHGHTSGYGGGVNCNAGSVLKNHILYNGAASGGGGVYFGNYTGDCWIEDNVIEKDTSPGGGGGIYVHARNCSIRRNTISDNWTENRGGGIKLEYDLGQGGPYPSTADTNITDNLIVSNHLTESNPKGGGILAWDWPRAARRNVVTDNDSNGIYVRVEYVGALDMGNADDPGLNVLMGNGRYELVDTSVGLSPTAVQAIGNYWGYLDTHTILGRILSYPSPNVAYDPVGASSRWFDVDLTPVSTCSTDVLVTGDLQVKRSLTVIEGKTFVFYLCPDTSLGNSTLTELIVSGSGTVLTSVGTAEDSIKYVPQAIASSSGRYWYGIEMLSGTEGYFGRCVIERAHCGIDVEPEGMAEVDDSRLDSCVFAGAYCLQGSLDVEHSDVSCNGGYGIRYEALDGEADHFGVGYCTINSNVIAGVCVTGIAPARLPEYEQITHNTIDGNGITLYGVQAEDEANWPGIFENDISGCVQAGVQFCGAGPTTVGNIVQSNLVDGIHCEGHEATLSSNDVHDNGLYGIFFGQGSGGYVFKNIVQDNGVCGIACFDGSNSLVRENTVAGNPTGVSCDLTSFPDLGDL